MAVYFKIPMKQIRDIVKVSTKRLYFVINEEEAYATIEVPLVGHADRTHTNIAIGTFLSADRTAPTTATLSFNRFKMFVRTYSYRKKFLYCYTTEGDDLIMGFKPLKK